MRVALSSISTLLPFAFCLLYALPDGRASALEVVAVSHRRGRRRGRLALSDLLPLLARERLERLKVLLREFGVKPRQLLRRPVVEILHHVSQLARERVCALDLRLRGAALVEDDVAVEGCQVLSQALLARNRAALLRGDYLLAKLVNLTGGVLQPLAERIARREFRRALVECEPHLVYLVDGERHLAELVAEFEREVELLFAILGGVHRARVCDDLELRRIDLLVLRHPHRVGSGQHARAEGRAEVHARGGRNARRLKAH